MINQSITSPLLRRKEEIHEEDTNQHQRTTDPRFYGEGFPIRCGVAVDPFHGVSFQPISGPRKEHAFKNGGSS